MKIDNTIGPYDRIDRLNGIIKDQKSRIAELEAEVALLKKPFIWKGDDLEELTEEVIRNRSIIDFEEGEGEG